MIKVICSALLLIGCAFCTPALGQEAFQNCTAAFLDNKIVVDDYSPTGKCSLAATATGKMTVCTADLSPNASVAVDRITFKIAIRDHQSKTLVMFSNENYQQVDIQKVLSKCRKGDHIVLLTLDTRYALPHNEILVL